MIYCLMDKKEIDYCKEFEKIFASKIKREGSKELLAWLKSTDFFTAPASTRFHGNFRGGLAEHCVRAYERFVRFCEFEFGVAFVKENAESLAVIALLHDVCKVDYYTVELRNVKVDGAWVQKPYYAIEDGLPYGHGEKSVYMVTGFMKLTREEAMAINWHMGAFDARAKENSRTLNQAFEKFPLALVFHMADIGASYLDEKKII